MGPFICIEKATERSQRRVLCVLGGNLVRGSIIKRL